MNLLERRPLSQLVAGVLGISLSLAPIGFGIPSANAAGTATIDNAGVVVPGNVNTQELVINFSGTSRAPSVKFTGVTINKTEGTIPIVLSSTYQKLGSTDIEVKGTGSGTMYYFVGSTYVVINPSGNPVPANLTYRFPPGSLTFAASGPWSAKLDDGDFDNSPTNIQTVTLESKDAQATLSLRATSLNGTFGTGITLATDGGSGVGAVTYSVANGPSTSGCSISSDVLSSTSAGTCLVTATKAGDDSFSPVSSAQTSVSIARASRTLSFAATTATIAYGNTDTVLATPSAGSGDGAVTYSAGSSTACTVNSSTGVVTATQASGTCSITATIAEGTSYLTASTTIPVTVTAATRPLTVTAGSASVNFGTSYTINALANSSSGLSGLDAVSGATFIYTGTGSTTYGPTDVKPVNAGTYSVTASAATFSTGSAANYSVTYAAGAVTISRVSRTIAFATTSANLTFGGTVTVSASASLGDGAVTYSTSSSGCTVGTSSGLVTATGSSGTCEISASIAQGTNHLTASTTTQFTVTLAKRAITIDITDFEVAFGDSVNPPRVLSVGTLAGSDAISGVTYTYAGSGSTTYASSTTAPTAAGTYTVTPSVAVFSSGDVLNYNISYTPGTLTITKRPITITASNLSFLVGSTLTPAFTITTGSLLSGDVISGVSYAYAGSGSTVYASSSVEPTAAGSYSITPSLAIFSTGDLTNYQVTYAAGTLTIQAPAPEVVQNSPTQTIAVAPVVTSSAPAVTTSPVGSIGVVTTQTSGRALIGGVPADAVIALPSSTQVSVQVGSLQLGMSFNEGVNGQGRVESGNSAFPELFVPAGNASTMSGSGLMPGSFLQIWLGGNSSSAATELARIPVNPDGSYEGQVIFSRAQSLTPVALGRQVIQVSGFDAFGNQTVVEMVITIAQGPVVPEVMRDTGTRPALSLGQFMATFGGEKAIAQAKIAADGSAVSFEGQDWNFGLSNAGVSVGGSNESPEIRFLEGGSATFQASGLMPGTKASVWFFSDPVLAGTGEVAEDGSVSIDFMVDSSFIPLGQHTLQMQGVGKDGFIVAVNWGVGVEQSSSVLNDAILWIVGILGTVGLVTAVIWVLARRRLSA